MEVGRPGSTAEPIQGIGIKPGKARFQLASTRTSGCYVVSFQCASFDDHPGSILRRNTIGQRPTRKSTLQAKSKQTSDDPYAHSHLI